MLSATIDRVDEAAPADRYTDQDAESHRSSAEAGRRASRREVLVDDLSITGFRYFSPERLAVGTFVRLSLAGAGTVAARIVRQDVDEHVCIFTNPLTAAQVASALTAASAPDGTVPLDLAPHDKWPRVLRTAILIGGGAAAWAAAVAVIRAIG
jgi:hypothetical protein